MRIAQAISCLDSRYAQVWQGYCADKTNGQISRETGLSISTVKRMLGVLRSTLQAVMEEDNS